MKQIRYSVVAMCAMTIALLILLIQADRFQKVKKVRHDQIHQAGEQMEMEIVNTNKMISGRTSTITFTVKPQLSATNRPIGDRRGQ